MSNRFTMLLIAAGLAAGVPAGCGGDGGDPTSGSAASASDGEGAGVSVTTSSLGKRQFIKQASAACVRAGRNLNEEAGEYIQRHNSENLPENVTLANVMKAVVLPSIEAQAAAFMQLGAPAGDEATIEAILTAQQKGIDRIRGLKKVKSTEVLETYFKDFNQGLEDYGFTACVYG